MSITFSLCGQTSPENVRTHMYACSCVHGHVCDSLYLLSDDEQVAWLLLNPSDKFGCPSCLNRTGVCQWNENLDDVNFANVNAHLVLAACGFSGEELHYGECLAKDFEVKARRGLMRLDIFNAPVRDRLGKLIELAAKRDNDSVIISWG